MPKKNAQNRLALMDYEDFLSTDIHIKVRNLTSETVVDSEVKTIGSIPMGGASEENLIQVVEVLAGGFALSVPKYTCTVGHNLEVRFQIVHLAKQDFSFKVIGKVKTTEKTSATQERIEIELKRGSDLAWQDFCKLLSQKQDAIHAFFKNVRGY